MIRSSRFIRRLCVLVVAMVSIAMTVPAVSYAQNVNPTDEEYGNGVLAVSGGGGDGSGSGAPVSGGDVSGGEISSLPFTGLDVVAIAAIGVGLIGAGFVVRRASSTGDQA